MSLEEIRLQNIARNNDFLKSLFGPTNLSPQPNVSAQKSPIPQALYGRHNQRLQFEELCKEVRERVIVQYPQRRAEIEQICSYLNPDMRASPACIVYGTCGSGKSSICNALLREAKLPHVILSGVGFTTAKSFLIPAWDSIKDSLKSYRIEIQEKYTNTLSMGFNLTRKITKFSELALSLGAILDNLFDASQLELQPSDQCFYIVIQGLHHISAQDCIFASSLLSLSQHSHRRIKVIAQSESAIPGAHLHHICVRFPAYSQKQLSVILSETLLARRLQIYVNNYTYTAVKHSIEGRREERKEDEDNGGPDDNYCRREKDVLHVIDSVVVQKLLDMVKQSISETFTRMLDAALPLLMYTTTHPTVLFDASLTCFAALYGNTSEELIHNIVVQYFRTIRAITPHKTSLSSSEVDMECLSATKSHFLPVATLSAVRVAVKLTHHLPSYTIVTPEVVTLARKRGILLSRPPLVLPKTQVDPETGAPYSSPFSEPVASAATVVSKRKWLPSELDKLDTNTMRVQGWCLSCPIRVRYLIVAAFLAGHNPKETDNMKFVGEQQGRRKKQRKGTDHDVDLAAKGNKEASKSNSSAALVARYFSLERLLSIYAQVVSIIEGKRAYGYGTVSIYTTLRSLVEKGIVSESSNWSLDRPMYLSAVSLDTATQLSKLMNFELQDFMHSKGSSYHSNIL